MRIHPLHASPWIPAVIAGAGFEVMFGILTVISGLELWAGAVILALAGGVLLSTAVGLAVWRAQRRFAPDIAGMSRESATLAYRVAQRGQAPADPEVRAAALRIAERNLASAGQTRLGLTIALACTLPGVVLVVLKGESGLGAVAAVAVVVGIGFAVAIPRQLRRRVEALRAAD
ncbi:hypothetical protein [Kribbella sp. CA-293567]|uniref:hypothetical protein n=1 Tax=Kribbella sp. CA-293567 TaxID=3002436 RepID=UPI0022DD3F33|nr:hypothetical protein [Kribbella sp. CA-293567]WBQ03068.1 hypothetical protein OX958_24170 [Kribbella sp. CA-293567]